MTRRAVRFVAALAIGTLAVIGATEVSDRYDPPPPIEARP